MVQIRNCQILKKEVDHDHLTKDVEVLPMTHFSGSILPQNVFIQASIFPWSPSLSAVFLGSRMSSTPDYSSITGWFGTKKSSKIHSTKRRGSQQATSHKLWSECTVVAKQTLPRGKEKQSFGMWRKKGPRVGGGGMGGREARGFIQFCGSWLSCTFCPEFLLDTIFFF